MIHYNLVQSSIVLLSNQYTLVNFDDIKTPQTALPHSCLFYQHSHLPRIILKALPQVRFLPGTNSCIFRFCSWQGWREGGGRGRQITQSAQRGPGNLGKCSYRLSSLMFILNEIRHLHTVRWSSWSIVKHTKCETNNFSIVITLYQLCDEMR